MFPLVCLLVKHGLAWEISAVRQPVFRELCGLFFSALCILFLLFFFTSQKFIENTGVPEGGLELVLGCFHSLLIWRHGIRIISPKQ